MSLWTAVIVLIGIWVLYLIASAGVGLFQQISQEIQESELKQTRGSKHTPTQNSNNQHGRRNRQNNQAQPPTNQNEGPRIVVSPPDIDESENPGIDLDSSGLYSFNPQDLSADVSPGNVDLDVSSSNISPLGSSTPLDFSDNEDVDKSNHLKIPNSRPSGRKITKRKAESEPDDNRPAKRTRSQVDGDVEVAPAVAEEAISTRRKRNRVEEEEKEIAPDSILALASPKKKPALTSASLRAQMARIDRWTETGPPMFIVYEPLPPQPQPQPLPEPGSDTGAKEGIDPPPANSLDEEEIM